MQGREWGKDSKKEGEREGERERERDWKYKYNAFTETKNKKIYRKATADWL